MKKNICSKESMLVKKQLEESILVKKQLEESIMSDRILNKKHLQ